MKCTSLEQCTINQTHFYLSHAQIQNTLLYTNDILSRSPNPKVTVPLSRKPVLCGKEYLHHLPLWNCLIGLNQEDNLSSIHTETLKRHRLFQICSCPESPYLEERKGEIVKCLKLGCGDSSWNQKELSLNMQTNMVKFPI